MPKDNAPITTSNALRKLRAAINEIKRIEATEQNTPAAALHRRLDAVAEMVNAPTAATHEEACARVDGLNVYLDMMIDCELQHEFVSAWVTRIRDDLAALGGERLAA